jgi:hypothetical protein
MLLQELTLSMANSQILAQTDRPGQSCEIPTWCYLLVGSKNWSEVEFPVLA